MLRRSWLPALGIWAMLVAVALAAPPHKALIVDGQNGHKWQTTTPVLKMLLEERGLFTVDVATSPPRGKDMSGFKPDFAAYDRVVSNYQGDAWPEETKKAFVEYRGSISLSALASTKRRPKLFTIASQSSGSVQRFIAKQLSMASDTLTGTQVSFNGVSARGRADHARCCRLKLIPQVCLHGFIPPDL